MEDQKGKINNKVYLNFKCNNSCIFCFNKWSEDFLTEYAEIKNQIEKVDKKKHKKIDFYGAEPLTDKKTLLKSLKLANDLGFYSTLASNCTLLDENIINKFNQYKVKGIRTSLHGHNSKMHDFITRRKGSFNETIKNLKLLVKLFLGKVVINTVITKLNYKRLIEIAKLIDLIDKKKKFIFKISGLRFNGNKQIYKSLCVPYEQIRPYLVNTVEYLEGDGRQFCFERLPYCILSNYFDRFIQINKSDDGNGLLCQLCNLCDRNKDCYNSDIYYKELILNH